MFRVFTLADTLLTRRTLADTLLTRDYNCTRVRPLVRTGDFHLYLRFPRTGDVDLSIDTVPDG